MLCYAAIPIICQGIPGIAVVHIAEKYYFTPTTQPPLHTTLTIGAAGASP